MVKPLRLGNREVGDSRPCLIIAEAGVNHNGSFDTAIKLVDAAAEAGVDAVKFQTFKAERLVHQDAPQAKYQQTNTGRAESQLEMLKRLELSDIDHVQLQARCREKGILFCSTPFDEESVDFLNRLEIPFFKISSGDLTNIPFLSYVASYGLPVILSTGMSELEEIYHAVKAIRSRENEQIILLQCVSNYPADPADVNLRAMVQLSGEFGCLVGLSDHTLGIEISLAAVALGACLIEKHYTLDKSMSGPDHRASIDPGELRSLVNGVRKVEIALGGEAKRCRPSEVSNASVARKSLHWKKDLPAGVLIGVEDLVALRPGTGISPARFFDIVSKRTAREVRRGSLVEERDWERRAT